MAFLNRVTVLIIKGKDADSALSLILPCSYSTLLLLK